MPKTTLVRAKSKEGTGGGGGGEGGKGWRRGGDGDRDGAEYDGARMKEEEEERWH